MTLDYAKKQVKKTNRVRISIAFFIIFTVIALLLFVLVTHFSHNKTQPVVTHPAPTIPKTASKTTPSKNQFDFYTILPQTQPANSNHS